MLISLEEVGKDKKVNTKKDMAKICGLKNWMAKAQMKVLRIRLNRMANYGSNDPKNAYVFFLTTLNLGFRFEFNQTEF